MVENEHDYEHEYEPEGPRRSWAALLGGLLAGLLIGGLAGAVSMLLLAPRSGKRTRARLRQQGIELREQAAETVEDTVAQARVKTHQVAHDVRRAGQGAGVPPPRDGQ
jgi:hypothetical protein